MEARIRPFSGRKDVPFRPLQPRWKGLSVSGYFADTEVRLSLMQPKLKETPREWLKFTAVMALLVSVLSFMLLRWAFPVVVGIAAFTLVLCALRPRLFRGFYRAGMTISFYIGQVMGRILLTIFFILVVTPLGLLLRLGGKDLLQLKRPTGASSYWRPAKTSNQFDRMF